MHEQAWLSYTENREYVDKVFFNNLYANFSGSIYDNIVSELENFTQLKFEKRLVLKRKKVMQQ